jgi:hypothetical protein
MKILFILMTLLSTSAFACQDHLCGGRAPLEAEKAVKKDDRFKNKVLEYRGGVAEGKDHYLFRVTSDAQCQDVYVTVNVPKNCKMTSKIQRVKPCTQM